MARVGETTQASSSSRRRPFFSLKWTAVLALSLVLMGVNAALVMLGVGRLEGQLERQRQLNTERQAREFEALIEHSFSDLERIAPLILQQDDDPSTLSSYQGQMPLRLADRMTSLEFDWDITTLSFMDAHQTLRFAHGPGRGNILVRQMLWSSFQTETAGKILTCSRECRQFVAVPILQEGELSGVMLLGRTVADAVYAFRSISASDLAIVSDSESTPASPNGNTWLQSWGRRVVLASGAENIIPALRDLSSKVGLNELQARHPYRFNHENKAYDVQRISTAALDWKSLDDFLLISDITAEVDYIQRTRRQSLLMGLVGFLISEMLLLFLLWGPMSRLKRLASILPRLAEGDTVQLRSGLSAAPPRGLEDEIDVAWNAVLNLASRLEALNQEVETRTDNLIQRSMALARERDFVAGLLNSAQVIILTQDAEGRIQSLNLEGQRITGRDASVIGQELFLDLLEPSCCSDELVQALKMLGQGSLQSYQHDGHLLTPDGQRRSVSWVHSRLVGSDHSEGMRILSVGLDITEREEAETNLAWLADHDPLTELINRRRFQIDFQRILLLNQRYKRHGALFFFDLDQFKYVNDTSGHQAGDAMLREVANVLRQVVRESDLLARLGGDEFALVVPETDPDGAILLANKIMDRLTEIELPVKGRSHRISASIGIALFPEHGTNIHDLMANADLSMYQAKDVGRGRWHMFSRGELRREQLDQEVRWKQKIEQALQDERFFLQFQPIIEIKGGRTSHYEVLIRMREPDGKVVTPDSFIPVAERSGLIHRIDRYVLQQAISTLVDMRDSNLSLSINLSGKVVDDPELLPLLRQLLQISNLRPDRLLFEITETAALADIQAAERLMRTIRDLGCQTALDDFGVGFSSFLYLKELPVDIVKIDGSFIRNLPRSTDDRIFVKAMAEVAHGLGKRTIAEFVEDEVTLDMLRELGVDYAQGYFIGKPGPLPR